MAKVSITVPVCNYGRYLRRCLDSLVAQTLKDIEIICVDAGSTDDSLAIVEEYAARDGRFRILRLGAVGVASARNAALEASTAPYLMACDSDDWAEPTWCEELYEAIERSGADFAVARAFIDGECPRQQKEFLEGNQVLRYQGLQTASSEMFGRIDAAVWIKIFRRDLVERYAVRYPDGAVYEDWLFSLEYLAVAKSVRFLDRRLYHYVQHRGSILNGGVPSVKRSLDVIGNWRQFRSFLVRTDRWDAWRPVFAEGFVMAVRRTSDEVEDVRAEVYDAANVLLDELPPSDFDGLSDECLRGLGMIRDRTLGRLKNLRWKIGPVTVAKYKCSLEGAKAYVLGLRVYKKVFK